MIPRPAAGTPLPSRGALRVLRRLALAGSTVGAIGSACTVATISYEVNRRIRLAEGLVENKRSLKTTCPNYDSTARGVAVAKMMEAAEAGEFLGVDSIRKKEGDDAKKQDSHDGEESSDLEPRKKMVQNMEEALAWMQSLHEPWNLRVSTLRPRTTLSANRTRNDSNFTKLLNGLQAHNPSENGREEVLPTLPSYRLQYRDNEADNAVLAEKLLQQGKSIEATQRFLRAYPTVTPKLPEEAKQLCIRLFDESLKEDNVHLAHRLFRWMDHASVVSQDAWESLIASLAKKWNLELIATLYVDHADEFELSKPLRDPVLRSLADSFRLEEAKTMIFRFLKDDNDCTLCAIYLGRLWKKTRNVDLVAEQFKAILSSFQENEMQVSQVLFNPLLEAYIESGQDESAEELVENMRAEHKLSLPARTLGLLAYGRSLKSDWEGVERYFEEMQKLDLRPGGKWFAKIFDRIFLEYFLGNSASKIREFVYRAVDKYNLVPDKVLFEHIVRAYIQKGNPKMVMELIEVAEKRAWPVIMKRDRFIDLLRIQRQKCGKANGSLWQMFRRFGRFSASQRILGFNKKDFPNDEAFELLGRGEPTVWSRKLNSKNSSKDFNRFPALYQQMIHHIHVGSMDKAIEVFREAKMLGKPMRELDVDLALTATIVHNGSIEEAKSILAEEKSSFPWIDISSMPLFFQKILSTQTATEAEALIMAVLNFYSILERQILPIKHHVTISTCSNLIRRGKTKTALRLIRAVNKSKYGGTTPFDPVGVKIIAKASSIVGNLTGVRWAILTALKRESALSRDLAAELYQTIECLKSRSPVSLDSDSNTDAYFQEVKFLENLADILDQKERFLAERASRLPPPPPYQNPTPGYAKPYGSAAGPEFIVPEVVDSNGLPLSDTLDNWLERVQLEYALTPSKPQFC
ncbi:hypothetical protein PRK78_001860 [Emydomyces testavorans]|uniref:Pentatricopeptide repeat protein n=1 Tax=Emydomyces testavorans TaxID=2070801 RepID=A0AAF0DDE9_9EURO|nr:hypothetical protein PRK78_001860 [Emydomyces testavorans]